MKGLCGQRGVAVEQKRIPWTSVGRIDEIRHFAQNDKSVDKHAKYK